MNARAARRYYRFLRELLLRGAAPGLHQLIVDRMAEVVAAGQGTLALYNDEEEALVIVATYGYPAFVMDHIRIPPGEGILGRVFMTRRAECTRVQHLPQATNRQLRYRGSAYMAVPLISGGGPIGALSVTDPAEGDVFTRDQFGVLRAYAIPAALALEREAMRDRNRGLAHLATVDALTAISNRRHFDERLEQEIQRGRREQTELSLLMIDIDDFKVLNDTRGHQSGDAVLKEVAEILRRSIRSFDLCARYGGEEFAILMPGAAVTTAYQVAERIRRHTEVHFSESWRFGSLGRPTLSIGISASRGEVSGEALVAAADAALLAAKAAGKNRVRLHQDESDASRAAPVPGAVANQSAEPAGQGAPASAGTSAFTGEKSAKRRLQSD